jgi:hypothetical protein
MDFPAFVGVHLIGTFHPEYFLDVDLLIRDVKIIEVDISETMIYYDIGISMVLKR